VVDVGKVSVEDQRLFLVIEDRYDHEASTGEVVHFGFEIAFL
jgi:hypothetical protein